MKTHRSILILFVFVLLSGCSSMMYYPSRNLFYDPAQFGVKPEEVSFSSEDGTKLFGWYFHSQQKDPKGLFVFFHGNGDNLSSHYLNLLWTLKEGYDFFIFDYRGYGRSEDGAMNPKGTVHDGHAAIRWAHQHSPKLTLIVFGQSLGGAVALRCVMDMKGELPIRLVVVDSTFPSYEEIGRRVMTKSFITWPFQWLSYLVLSDRYAPGEGIKEISPIPLLVIHGDQDQTVDFELGEEVFAYAREPKEFWRIPGGRHADVFFRENGKYRAEFLKYLDRRLR